MTDKALELKNKIEELKNEFNKYNQSADEGVEKRRNLTKIQMEIGKHAKQLVLVLREEGYTTQEIAKRLGISESSVINIEG